MAINYRIDQRQGYLKMKPRMRFIVEHRYVSVFCKENGFGERTITTREDVGYWSCALPLNGKYIIGWGDTMEVAYADFLRALEILKEKQRPWWKKIIRR